MNETERTEVKGVSDTLPKQESRKNVWNLGIVSFFNDTASEMIYPLIPSFIVGLGAGPAALGMIEGIAETTASLVKYFSGGLSDRLHRRKPIFFAGYLFSNIIRPLIGIVGTWPQLLLARFGDRIGKGVRSSPRDALLADSVTENERGWAFGVQRAMDHSGAVIGPLIASLLLAIHIPLRYVFLLSIIPGLIAVYWLWQKVIEIKPPATSTHKPVLLKGGLAQFDHMFKLYLLTIIIFTLGNSTDAFLLLRARDLEISLALIPILWTVFHISKAVFSIPGGWISDRIGRKPTIIAGWIIYALVYLGFAFARTSSHIWWLFLIYGLYYGLTEGVERAYVADFVTADKRGTAYGLYHLSVGIGAFPASLLFGAIWKFIGPVPAFIFGALLSTISVVLLITVVRKHI